MEKPVSSPSTERRALEDNLRSKLEDASTRYKWAHASYRKELEKESEGRGNATGALFGAREEESQALAEYRHALQTFTDLTVHGKQPGAQAAETFESLGNNSLIAVVDDDESVRESLNTFLRSVGYQVRTFPSADRFLGSGSYGETECLLLDLRMPEIDGFELQSRLNAEHSKIPIVIITAHEDQLARQRAIAAGAMDVLHKPFAARLLLEAVEKALQKTAAWRVGQSA
jgi:CheY-like chemotaxis protein